MKKIFKVKERCQYITDKMISGVRREQLNRVQMMAIISMISTHVTRMYTDVVR